MQSCVRFLFEYIGLFEYIEVIKDYVGFRGKGFPKIRGILPTIMET